MSIKLGSLERRPALLSEVKRLGRRNSRTLGFLPKGAFDAHAQRGQIVVATLGRKLAGYVLYREARTSGTVTIVHLCVATAMRGTGVARALFESLCQRVEGAPALVLWCRSDFEASRLWPRLGFVARGEKQGRAGTLVRWIFKNESADQLEILLRTEERSERLKVAIDASVFFRLVESEGHSGPQRMSAGTVESRALLADWLEPIVELFVTAELENEISRAPDHELRNLSRNFARRFPELGGSNTDFQSSLGPLEDLLPGKHEADRRQIARAIAGGADYFVTRDQRTLKAAGRIVERCGLEVLSPTGLIVRLDSELSRGRYGVARLSGSTYSLERPVSVTTSELLSAVLDSASGEKKGTLRRTLDEALSSPDTGSLSLVRDENKAIVAAAVFHEVRTSRGWKVLEIPLLRLSPRAKLPELAGKLVELVLARALSVRASASHILDSVGSDQLSGALSERAYQRTGDGWQKWHERFVGSAGSLRKRLRACPTDVFNPQAMETLATTLKSDGLSKSPSLQLAVERLHWPAKLTSLEIPCYLVPIRPAWALNLFDEQLAASQLFGTQPELAFSRENVYYRAPRPQSIGAPARLLWYVSQESRTPGSGAIRACSYLDDVYVGDSRRIFRMNQKLGIWKWSDVDQVGRSHGGEVMALRFSDTELFDNPVPFSEVQSTLEKYGKRNQIQSPVVISRRCFFDFYTAGHGVSSDAVA